MIWMRRSDEVFIYGDGRVRTVSHLANLANFKGNHVRATDEKVGPFSFTPVPTAFQLRRKTQSLSFPCDETVCIGHRRLMKRTRVVWLDGVRGMRPPIILAKRPSSHTTLDHDKGIIQEVSIFVAVTGGI